MKGKNLKISVTVGNILLLSSFAFSGCAPGPPLYEGPMKQKTNVVLREGKEYFVCFESKNPGASQFPGGGASSSVSADEFPNLESIVTLCDDTGNPISNTLSRGRLKAYYSLILSFGRCGITVARFRLEGKESRGVDLRVKLDAYRKFATLYNRRHAGLEPVGGTGGFAMTAWAPLQPNKIVIRGAQWTRFLTWKDFAWALLAVLFWVYIIYAYYKVRGRGRAREQSSE